ncbi:MAG: DUF937 domain-containing protein [Alphaproteobacteria bacterium]|jgi:hypothetical protein|nr:DUF937 domain-containing protein [Alphaproteobacteria bacterium]MBK9586213.1 DUF937 domain-containing protein [Alphaproteobacteria bacterium]MBP7758169.1 DUF937 domain-containing protein [Alphaproteobacteria bacterium]MBP7761398.1 DUF937 domain-containing protein [Alphaproteobacteria bacterium]MBP7905412.1 DUF937 domain-containing protein [Alphaproteobacteria bacterium]
MNNFLDLINYAAQKPEMVSSLAAQFGLDQKQTDEVTKMLISAVAGGMLNNVKNGGLENLTKAIETGQHEQLLEKVKTPGANLFNVVQEGNGILGHILGSKDVSRQVASAVQQKTNVEADIIKTMLPIIASTVMGLLAQSQRKQGSSQFSGNMLGMLDMNQDGNPIDDIFRLIGSLK